MVPTSKVAPGRCVVLMVAIPQLSDAVGAVQVAVALVPDVETLMFAGQPANTGAVRSVAHGSVAAMVTKKLQTAVLLLASLAV